MRCGENESLRSKLNDCSSISSDKDSSSRETSKSPLAMKQNEKDGEFKSWENHILFDIASTSKSIFSFNFQSQFSNCSLNFNFIICTKSTKSERERE